MRYRSHLEYKHAYVSFPQKIVGSLKKKIPSDHSVGLTSQFLALPPFSNYKIETSCCCLLEKSLSSGEFSRLKKHFNIFAHIVVHMKKEQLEEKSVLRPVYF